MNWLSSLSEYKELLAFCTAVVGLITALVSRKKVIVTRTELPPERQSRETEHSAPYSNKSRVTPYQDMWAGIGIAIVCVAIAIYWSNIEAVRILSLLAGGAFLLGAGYNGFLYLFNGNRKPDSGK